VDKERRSEERQATGEKIGFILPVMHGNDMNYIDGDGQIINKSTRGICLKTNIPLEPGHVLKTITFSPYLALVRWVSKENSHIVAGLLKK
jgi:hypothetical protein